MADSDSSSNIDDKLTSLARHIAKSLAQSPTMAGDFLTIYSNFDVRLHSNLSLDAAEQSLASLRKKISPFLSHDSQFWSSDSSPNSFLTSIDRLISLRRDWTHDTAFSSCLDAADDLLRQSTSRLIVEFKTLARRTAAQFLLDDEIGDELHEIAKRLAAAGMIGDCSDVYVACRQELLEDALFTSTGLNFNFTTTTIDDEIQKLSSVHMEEDIDKWIKTATLAVEILYPGELHLHERVFSDLPSNLTFTEISDASFIRLIDLANALVNAIRPSPERLFKLLDLYETVRDLIPQLEILFTDNYKAKVDNFMERLGEIIKGIFTEFENLIRRDPPKDVVPGGGLHPINRYVTNYLCAVCQSQQALHSVFQGEENENALSVHIARIMELLESNLESKSKVYRDPALSSVFMMNNVRYIVRKVKGDEMGTILGEDWIRKRTAKIRQYHVSYQRHSWSKVLGILKFDSSTPMLPYGSPKSLRNKLKAFNSCFDEISKVQSTWVIFDDQLREELRISVSGTLSPAYRSFVGRVRGNPEVDKCIKYSVEDVEDRIAILFQGSSGRR